MFYVYILKLRDKTLYTGYTKNLTKRIKQHQNGSGSRYVKGRRPFTLVYTEKFEDRGDATKRERQIKSLSREKKEKLVGINSK